MSNLTDEEKALFVALLKKARGDKPPGRKPFGITKSEKATLARIDKLHDKGYTLQKIADTLTAEKRKTKSGKPWTAAIVNKLLSKKKGGEKR